MSAPKESKRTPVDWDAVAIDIRAGILTDREIGAKYGRSHGAIQQYANKHGIERDLTARIQQRTKTKLAKAQLAKVSSQEHINAYSKPTQDQTIEIAAEAAATIVIKQQGRIGRHLALSQKLLAEIESQTIDSALYEQLGDLMVSPDARGMDRLNELYRKVIDTPSRIDMHKKAVETEKILVSMERQAFNIPDVGEDPVKKPGEVGQSVADGVESAMRALAEKVSAE